MSPDEKEGHGPRHLPEEAEVGYRIPAEPPTTDNTMNKACEMIRIIKSR